MAPTVTPGRQRAGNARAEPVVTAWIWRLDVTDGQREESVLRTHLTDAERRRASRGTGPVRRRRILLRGALRQALGDLLDLPPALVPMLEVDGRPLLAAGPDLHVSCSASGSVGLVAVVSGAQVGIDVQEHRDQDARATVAEGWLCPAEEGALRSLPPADRPLAVTRCWTQKEAVLKALGVGLRQHPATVATPVAEAGRIADWWAAPVPVPVGHVATVVVRTPLDELELIVQDMTPGGGR